MSSQERKVKAIYPHAFPDFELDSEKWLGISFGAAELAKGGSEVPLVGFVFDEHGYAAKVYELVLSWIGEENVEEVAGMKADRKKCVRVAVIEDSDSSYIFYCHPNFNHPSAVNFYDRVDDSRSRDEMVAEREAVMLFLGKRCQIGEGTSSRYRWFRDRHRPGEPVALEFLIPTAVGDLEIAKGTSRIIIFDVLFSPEDALADDDPLRDLIQIVRQDHRGDPGQGSQVN